jgi:hypothetical protein
MKRNGVPKGDNNEESPYGDCQRTPGGDSSLPLVAQNDMALITECSRLMKKSGQSGHFEEERREIPVEAVGISLWGRNDMQLRVMGLEMDRMRRGANQGRGFRELNSSKRRAWWEVRIYYAHATRPTPDLSQILGNPVGQT